MENADKLDQFGQAFVASPGEPDRLPDPIGAGEETALMCVVVVSRSCGAR